MPHKDPDLCIEITKMQVKIEELEKEMIEIKTYVRAMYELWQHGIGVFKFIKFIFYVVAPIMAALYWIKDHVKL